MTRLIIHAGQGKTGSSYLQSMFAINREFLSSYNIDYPISPSMENAKKGLISSGNGESLMGENLPVSDHATILFSREHLFFELLDSPKLLELANTFDVEVMIYTRNVIEFLVSYWAQGIKRGGVQKDFNSWIVMNHNKYLSTLLKWLQNSKQLGFQLKIRNYSNCKDQLAADFFEKTLNLDFNLNDLKFPPNKLVNRSLTNSEYEIQRLFNHAYGKSSSKFISDFLVNNFPDEQSLKIRIDKETFTHIKKENEDLVDELNKYLPNEHKLELGSEDEWVTSHPIPIMKNDVMRELSKSIKPLFLSLNESNANAISEVALKIADKHNDLENALKLMRIALQIRPNVPLIKSKVEEWSSKIESPDPL